MSKKNMEFNDFLNEVRDKLPDYLMQYDIESINISPVSKNNGKKCTGMAIVLRGEQVAPNIYMEYYYMLYCQEHDMDHVLKLIADEYKEASSGLDQLGFTLMNDDVCMVKDNIFLKLINMEKNKSNLSECPYLPFMDLAISFRVMVQKDKRGMASAALKHSDLERWNLEVDALYGIAYENTRKLFPPVIKKLETVIGEKLDDTRKLSQNSNLYVFTNADGINGASCIVFEDILKEFGEKHGSFFILPSSIHETLLLPVCSTKMRGELEEMVRDINKYVVSDMDYLSDSVYYYDVDKGKIEL
ncbi:MAG: DUF5688 family protein [Clostridium sp.]|nr:DUF5688 family protein [Clostridium sp.]MCM1398177.1 DUF5688 family protein [Clostridium sp.]MCM1460992.1 DUF5688 family protein [Bacteroides sp.]